MLGLQNKLKIQFQLIKNISQLFVEILNEMNQFRTTDITNWKQIQAMHATCKTTAELNAKEQRELKASARFYKPKWLNYSNKHENKSSGSRNPTWKM